ncbi:MAG: DUF4035 domain-containing protein [Planctomycetes bacterium]|nr:DUF4035 domain-containing protein [Planctomycetota bacterium]
MDPFGGLRGDYQAALIAKTIADVNRGKNRPAYKLKNFLLSWGSPTTTKVSSKLLEWKLRFYSKMHNAFSSKKKGGG